MRKENHRKLVVGVDIGGTKIMTAVFSPEGTMLAKDVCPTLSSEGVNQVVGRICAAIENLLSAQNLESGMISAICIACAGGIDTGRGVVVTPSPSLPGWMEIPLAEMVGKKLGIKTLVVNDASAAALGEYHYGAGRGVKNLVLFTLGTGIGGGIVIDGKLYLGAVGGAAELGHMTVEAHGPKCGCGNTGCLEIFASGTAITKNVIGRLDRGEKSSLLEMAGRDLKKMTAEMVSKAARGGDQLAQDVIARAAYYLGVGIVNVINVFNPELVIIGGGMAEMGEMIIGQGKQMAVKYPFSINARAARVVLAQLGNEAGVYGAAVFALDAGRIG